MTEQLQESNHKIVPNSDGESSDKIVPNQVPIYDGNSLGISPTSQSYDRYIKKPKVVSFLQKKLES